MRSSTSRIWEILTPSLVPITWVGYTFLLVVTIGCGVRCTDDPTSPVGRVKKDLRAIIAGTTDEAEGKTQSEECYVLLYGYQGSLESLQVSQPLQRKLKDLTPVDYERFVLVHAIGDDVTECTQWQPGDEPLIRPVPLLIRGNPFKITVKERKSNKVTLVVQQ